LNKFANSYVEGLDVRRFVHHNIIHKETLTNATVYQNFISYFYEAQNVSGDTPPIIRSLKLHQQLLVLHTMTASSN